MRSSGSRVRTPAGSRRPRCRRAAARWRGGAALRRRARSHRSAIRRSPAASRSACSRSAAPRVLLRQHLHADEDLALQAFAAQQPARGFGESRRARCDPSAAATRRGARSAGSIAPRRGGRRAARLPCASRRLRRCSTPFARRPWAWCSSAGKGRSRANHAAAHCADAGIERAASTARPSRSRASSLVMRASSASSGTGLRSSAEAPSLRARSICSALHGATLHRITGTVAAGLAERRIASSTASPSRPRQRDVEQRQIRRTLLRIASSASFAVVRDDDPAAVGSERTRRGVWQRSRSGSAQSRVGDMHSASARVA